MVRNNADRALNLIQEYLGVPYVWGGTTPKGFDCSGLLQYVWGKTGVKIPRVTYDQYKAGMAVGKNQLKPGDAVFFKGSDSKGGLPGHVGMYIGNGKFIEAPGRGKKVRVSLLAARSDYVGARRYAKAPLSWEGVTDGGPPPSPSQPAPSADGSVQQYVGDYQPPGGPPTPDSTIAGVYAPGTVQANYQPQQHQDTWQLLAAQPLASPETQMMAQRLTQNA